jgi:hypothetical protein
MSSNVLTGHVREAAACSDSPKPPDLHGPYSELLPPCQALVTKGQAVPAQPPAQLGIKPQGIPADTKQDVCVGWGGIGLGGCWCIQRPPHGSPSPGPVTQVKKEARSLQKTAMRPYLQPQTSHIHAPEGIHPPRTPGQATHPPAPPTATSPCLAHRKKSLRPTPMRFHHHRHAPRLGESVNTNVSPVPK